MNCIGKLALHQLHSVSVQHIHAYRQLLIARRSTQWRMSKSRSLLYVIFLPAPACLPLGLHIYVYNVAFLYPFLWSTHTTHTHTHRTTNSHSLCYSNFHAHRKHLILCIPLPLPLSCLPAASPPAEGIFDLRYIVVHGHCQWNNSGGGSGSGSINIMYGLL